MQGSFCPNFKLSVSSSKTLIDTRRKNSLKKPRSADFHQHIHEICVKPEETQNGKNHSLWGWPASPFLLLLNTEGGSKLEEKVYF